MATDYSEYNIFNWRVTAAVNDVLAAARVWQGGSQRVFLIH